MHMQSQRSFTRGPSASVCPCVTSALTSDKGDVLLSLKDGWSNTGLGRSRRTRHACALFARDVLLKQVVVRVTICCVKQLSTGTITPHMQ